MSLRINEIEGKPFTGIIFLVERIDPEQDHQIEAKLFEVASTQIGYEVPHWEMNEKSTPPIGVQAQAASLLDINAQDAQVSKLQKLMISACGAQGTIFAGWWFEKEWALEPYHISLIRYVMGEETQNGLLIGLSV